MNIYVKQIGRVSWRTEAKRQVCEQFDRYGYEVSFYHVPGRGAGCTTRRAGVF